MAASLEVFLLIDNQLCTDEGTEMCFYYVKGGCKDPNGEFLPEKQEVVRRDWLCFLSP